MSENEDDEGATATVTDLMETSELLNVHEPDPSARTFTIQELNNLGMPVPVADPDVLRAAYAFRQKMVASILDREHDFLYTISYTEQGKTREKMTTSYKEALKFSDTYRVPYKAVPKKSGIAKLATAFNIEGRIVTQRGLPIDDKATYSYFEYEVMHKASGKRAVGIGWARRDERGYPMPEHHMMALADTRAWGRAVLRICGFGEAGAEEIGSDVVLPPTVRVEMGPQQSRALPAPIEVLDVQATQEARVPISATRAPTPTPAQAAPTTPQAAPAPQPKPVPSEVLMPAAPVITDAQVAKLSALLKAKCGSVDKAKAWLMTEVKLDTTRLVREADYPGLLAKLEAMEVP